MEGQAKSTRQTANGGFSKQRGRTDEKLREHNQPESELSVPGAQNAESERAIKDEKSPNTE